MKPDGPDTYHCYECGLEWLEPEQADYCAAVDMAELDEQEGPA